MYAKKWPSPVYVLCSLCVLTTYKQRLLAVQHDTYCIDIEWKKTLSAYIDGIWSHSEMSWRKQPMENMENWFRHALSISSYLFIILRQLSVGMWIVCYHYRTCRICTEKAVEVEERGVLPWVLSIAISSEYCSEPGVLKCAWSIAVSLEHCSELGIEESIKYCSELGIDESLEFWSELVVLK